MEKKYNNFINRIEKIENYIRNKNKKDSIYKYSIEYKIQNPYIDKSYKNLYEKSVIVGKEMEYKTGSIETFIANNKEFYSYEEAINYWNNTIGKMKLSDIISIKKEIKDIYNKGTYIEKIDIVWNIIEKLINNKKILSYMKKNINIYDYNDDIIKMESNKVDISFDRNTKEIYEAIEKYFIWVNSINEESIDVIIKHNILLNIVNYIKKIEKLSIDKMEIMLKNIDKIYNYFVSNNFENIEINHICSISGEKIEKIYNKEKRIKMLYTIDNIIGKINIEEKFQNIIQKYRKAIEEENKRIQEINKKKEIEEIKENNIKNYIYIEYTDTDNNKNEIIIKEPGTYKVPKAIIGILIGKRGINVKAISRKIKGRIYFIENNKDIIDFNYKDFIKSIEDYI